MNFVCDRCKQKYHVADEKLRGRAVTRFRCKKCENVIELDLAAVGPTTPSADESPTVTAPTVAAATIKTPSAKPPTTAPLSRPRAATMVGGPALGAAPAPKPPVRQRAATVTGTAVGGGIPARATAAAKATPDPSKERSTSAILNASETGWYAGIRDLPVGPLSRKELLTKVQSGDVTADTLVWREGLDDWRPLRNVAELGDMLRAGAQKMSGNLLDEMGKRPAAPARGGQVVPIGSARTAGSARPSAGDEDEEATRVTGLDPSIAAMAARAITAAKVPAPADPAEDETLVNQRRAAAAAPIAAKPAKLSHDELLMGPTVDTSAKPAEPAKPIAAAAATGLDDLPEDLFAKPAKPVEPAPQPSAPVNLGAPGVAAPLLAPAPLAQPSIAPTFTSAPPGSSGRPEEKKRGGLSLGVIVLIGGVLVAGVGMGIFIGRNNNNPAPTPAPAPAPTPAPTLAVNTPAPQAVGPSVGEPIVAPPPTEPAPENPAQAAPATTAPAAPEPSGGHRDRTRRDRTAPNTPTARTPTAAELAALRELGGPAASTGGGPVGNTQLRSTQAPSANAPAGAGESDTARANRAVRAFESSHVANNCWQQVLRLNPAMRSGAVTVEFTVTNLGRFTSVDVANSPDQRFTQCLRARAGGIQPLAAGSQVTARVTVNLTAQ
jgi:predicted Zn finger-like uncharacterized protein